MEDKDKVYIKILTYEFEDEYVSFRIFSQGEWKVKLVTEWVEEDKVKLWSILHFAYSIRDTRMERLSVISTQNHCSFHLWQRESIKYCDEVIFTILQHRNHDTDSNEIRPMGCARIGKLKDSKVYKLRERLDNGDKLSREEKNWLTRNVKECCHFKEVSL